MALRIVIALVGAVVASMVAVRLARARKRSVVVWPIACVVVGATLFVFEAFLWERPAGDGASPAGFDMQMLLPVIGMLGTALLITYLPDRTTDRDD